MYGDFCSKDGTNADTELDYFDDVDTDFDDHYAF